MTTEELALLTAACTDRTNARAQEIVNVLGTSDGPAIVVQITLLPPEMQKDLEKHVREAIDEQRRRVRRR